jgi:transposase-like protein
MGSNGRKWTAEEKLQILDEARKAGQPVSDVCRRHQIAPAQFYEWEKHARAGALEALRAKKRGRKLSKTETYLKDEVIRLRTVVAELSAETLQLKKGLWP